MALIYQALTEDLRNEGPHPYGWDVKPLKGRSEIRIKLNQSYRVLILVIEPDLIVVKVARRKDIYE